MQDIYSDYDKLDHYWLRQDGTIYSSARRMDLAADDATYQEWQETGGAPTGYPKDRDGIESAGVLADVLGFDPYAPPPSVIETTMQEYEALIQARLDDFARTLTYDGMLSACTYATSTIEMYRIEGQYCVDARDATWAKAFELLNGFDPAQGIPSWGEIEAQLPVLAWPEGSRGYKPNETV